MQAVKAMFTGAAQRLASQRILLFGTPLDITPPKARAADHLKVGPIHDDGGNPQFLGEEVNLAPV